MPLTRLLGVIFVFAVASTAVAADIYVWRDTSGVSHYTTDLENVPPEFRKEAITVVKEWARAAPPPEPAAAPVSAVAADPGAAAPRDGYDAAYLAGFRAGERSDNTSNTGSNVGSVSQNVEVQPQSGAVADRLIPVPVIVDRRRERTPRHDDGRQEDARDRNRDSLPPAERAPFLQGPAGPPPINER